MAKKQKKQQKKLLIYTFISFKTVLVLQMLNRVLNHVMSAVDRKRCAETTKSLF